MPAVREALGCLILDHLHPRLDGKKRRGVKGDTTRVGVHLEAGQWKLDVSEEASLAAPGRAMNKGALEFFLKVARRICTCLALPLAIGSSALGRRVGCGESVDDLCRTVEGWKSWSFEERERVRSAAEFVLPVLWDVEGRGSHDWLLIVVASTVPGESLGAAGRLVARVADRFGRAQAAATAARKLEALVGGVGAHLGARMEIEMKGCPPCESAHESMILVLGLLLARVAHHAGVPAMESGAPTFVRDVRRALCAAFASMRAS